jgi:hypothetical protein
MAKKSSILKNDRRKALSAKYATRRADLKATIKNPQTSTRSCPATRTPSASPFVAP